MKELTPTQLAKKAYSERNKEKVALAKKVYREANRDKVKETNAKWYQRNKIKISARVKCYREKYPNKYKAHILVNNALQNKKLLKEPCENCGDEDNTHGHHDDYLKPLNVRWLCPGCHSQWHTENGEGLNS
jgi:transposase-like protein